MTETQPMAPTDAEIETLWQDSHPNRFEAISFARAVLAKWGTPPAVAGEPVATLHCNQDCYVWARATEAGKLLRFEEPMNLYTTPQPTQAQAVAREPLSAEQYNILVEDLSEWSRHVEVDTAPRSLEEHIHQVFAIHGLTSSRP